MRRRPSLITAKESFYTLHPIPYTLVPDPCSTKSTTSWYAQLLSVVPVLNAFGIVRLVRCYCSQRCCSKKLPRKTHHERYTRCPSRRRCRRTSFPAYTRSRQAGRTLCRPVPHHRHHAFELHQLRPAPRLHPHPVQGAFAQSPHPRGLGAGGRQRAG